MPYRLADKIEISTVIMHDLMRIGSIRAGYIERRAEEAVAELVAASATTLGREKLRVCLLSNATPNQCCHIPELKTFDRKTITYRYILPINVYRIPLLLHFPPHRFLFSSIRAETT